MGGCGTRGAPGSKLPFGITTFIVEVAGLTPGVAEPGDAAQVAPTKFVKQSIAIALLNDEFAGVGVMVAVYVAVPPGRTSRSTGTSVNEKSVAGGTLTVVGVVTESLVATRSVVAVEIVAVLLIMPTTVGRTTSVNVSGPPTVRLAMAQFTVPLAPTAGVVHVQPAGADKD